MSRTAVMFRVWRKTKDDPGGTVVALFPLESEGRGLCSSFEHVGQHGSADYTGVIGRTRAATPDEYRDLKRELEGAPYRYTLRVYKRRPRR